VQDEVCIGGDQRVAVNSRATRRIRRNMVRVLRVVVRRATAL
jgi:hypothetical protein